MTRFRLHVVFLFLVLWAAVLAGRLFVLQVQDYGSYAAFARGQQKVIADVDAERGAIFGRTRSGEEVTFATNRDFPALYAIPRDIADVGRIVEFLRETLHLDEASAADLKTRLEQPDDPYEPVANRLSEDQAANIREAQLPGLSLRTERDRFFPQGPRLAHVLGFVGYGDDGSRGGRYGVEAFFESALGGVAGKFRGERDGRGTLLEAFAERTEPSQPGASVLLTIEPNMQYQAEKFLRETVAQWKADGGTAIVMEPKSGKIRALANEPSFDPNTFRAADDFSVFTNAAVSVPYEPGSVFKPITMAAALDSGAVAPETTFANTGSVFIGGYTISNTLQQYNGTRTMIDVLRYSLNTGAVFVGEQTGQATFRSYLEAFGFGEPTGVMLPGEAAGSIANLRFGRPINYATAAFGQGISVTPLQLIRAIAAIGNGGTLMAPLIVEEIRHPNGDREVFEPAAVRRVVQQRTATRLTAMMARVVEDGTGVRAQIPGYTVAGKTGTAEIPKVGAPGYEEKNIHSFVGFFPAFDPQYIVLTKIDRPQGVRYAEATAVPLFRQIAEYLITYAGIPPDQPVSEKSK